MNETLPKRNPTGDRAQHLLVDAKASFAVSMDDRDLEQIEAASSQYLKLTTAVEALESSGMLDLRAITTRALTTPDAWTLWLGAWNKREQQVRAIRGKCAQGLAAANSDATLRGIENPVLLRNDPAVSRCHRRLETVDADLARCAFWVRVAQAEGKGFEYDSITEVIDTLTAPLPSFV